MVFWAANPAAAGKTGVENMAPSAIVDDSMLMGFTVGDESTVATLKITDVKQQVALQNGQTQSSHCIGCHTGTPDGDYVAFVDAWPWGAAFAGVKPGQRVTGNALTGFAGGTCKDWNNCTTPKTFVQYPWNGPMTFSPAHWNDAGDKVAIIATQVQDITMPWGQGSPNWQPGRLAWVDLNSTATTTTNGQTNPTLGTAFGYLAAHRRSPPGGGVPDLEPRRQVDRLRVGRVPEPGAAERVRNAGRAPLQGRRRSVRGAVRRTRRAARRRRSRARRRRTTRSTTPRSRPTTSCSRSRACPPGRRCSRTRTPRCGSCRIQAGAQAQRLAANDPPACSGKSSPGVNNHWPKWSPDRATVGNKTYYWLIFSSNRYGLPPVTTSSNGQTKTVQVSQLYITAVVVDEMNVDHQYSAIYLWNQPQNRLNTTPAWENFHIPIVVE